MSKPILSELEYNADDVASAILLKADLSIANDDLGVTDVSSSYTLQSGWANEVNALIAYRFMGFIFLNINVKHAGGSPGDSESIYTIDDDDLDPATNQSLPTVGYGRDLAYCIVIHTDGNIKIVVPDNPASDADFYVNANGWYRI
tara:strand:+ start:1177 stop:1611 length:435 start_codon:yes stop_codon:yes gene_type:complete